MLRVTTGLLAALLLVAAGNAAQADPTYTFTGTLGADSYYSTGLAGGSFTVTYQTGAFPTTGSSNSVNVDDFTVTVFYANGSQAYTFSDANATNDGFGTFYYSAGYAPFGILPSESLELMNPSNSGTFISLNLPVGFTGTGTVIAAGSESVYNTNETFIASGQGSAAAAVPEPSSIVLCGLAGVVGSVVAWRKRKRRLA